MGKMMRAEYVHQHHRSSSSSSIDSNTEINEYSLSFSSAASCSSSSLSSTNLTNNSNYTKDHLSTDLRLGLTLSHHHDRFSSSSSSPRGPYSDWPPIKGVLRNTLAGKSSLLNSSSRPTTTRRGDEEEEDSRSLFVKVYMEGIPIGRKLDLLSLHDGYHSLISTLSLMFNTTLLYPDIVRHNSSEKYHILTYEDKEGDWMMVGDVPWEMFLTTVKRLKIVTLDGCQ